MWYPFHHSCWHGLRESNTLLQIWSLRHNPHIPRPLVARLGVEPRSPVSETGVQAVIPPGIKCVRQLELLPLSSSGTPVNSWWTRRGSNSLLAQCSCVFVHMLCTSASDHSQLLEVMFLRVAWRNDWLLALLHPRDVELSDYAAIATNSWSCNATAVLLIRDQAARRTASPSSSLLGFQDD